MSAELLRYQIDGQAYDAWLQARAARRRTSTPIISSVIVEGVQDQEAASMLRFLQGRHGGRPIAPSEVEESILRISGSDRYEIIDYTLRAVADGAELVVRVTPKSYGPPFLMPAIDVQNVDSNSFALGLRARLALYDRLVPNSEIRLDLGAGTNQVLAVEIVKLRREGGLFVAPRAYFHRGTLNGYSDGTLLGEYRVARTGGGFDIGYTFGIRSEMRVGYDAANVRANLRVGVPSLPEASGSEGVASLRWTYDGQNSPLVPSRGIPHSLCVPVLLRYTGDHRERDAATRTPARCAAG